MTSTRQQRDGAAVRATTDREGVPWCSVWKCPHFANTRCALTTRATDAERLCVPAVQALAHERDLLIAERVSRAAQENT